MVTWKLIFLWILPFYHAANDGVFECGAHGRFEYCIDEIPGCVIGCHCHPGYYFDTETKICEPNSKLTQNYRRYMPQPTPVQIPYSLSDETETDTLPSPTTQSKIDEHVNDITKNVDELGDWLYNQFFKTIENQVINKTNKDSSLTRRSGRGPSSKHKTLKRRARKRKQNKHKSGRKDIKGRLLQIEEDDSLFHSPFEDEDADYDDRSSDSSDSDSSFDSDDEGHGHKKIVMINKKPKPQLPSFIFLPQKDTPFYPPIGLPPPPLMPMYPAVPVPPVMPVPPYLPYPGLVVECQESTTVTVAITPTDIKRLKNVVTTNDSTKTTIEVTTISDIKELLTNGPTRMGRNRYKEKKRGRAKSFDNIPDDEDLPSGNFTPTHEARQKALQRLRQRINNSPLKRNRKPIDNYNQLTAPDILMPNNNLNDIIFKDEISPVDVFDIPDQENVDFKYLSQLIHRTNENQTQNVPFDEAYGANNSQKKMISNPREWSQKNYHVYNFPLDSSRRTNQQIINTRDGQADDSYYSNLGRQIAKLIRTIDADNEHQLSLEIEKVQEKSNEKPFFSENGPRTFWERSVRSPLQYLHPLKYRYDRFKNSNELLFNIENRVEIVASTEPALSLQEIENMINVMEVPQTQSRSHAIIRNVQWPSQTLNINQLPHGRKQPNNSIKDSARPNVFDINRREFTNYLNNTRPKLLNTNLINVEMQGFLPISDQVDFRNIKDDSRYELQIHPVRKSTNTKTYFLRNKTEETYPQTVQKPKFLSVHNSEILQYPVPTSPNYKNIKKYFFDDMNHFSFQNENIPIHYSVSKFNTKQLTYSSILSPYFHHEIKHVDYTL